jgi:hypothetical protein
MEFVMKKIFAVVGVLLGLVVGTGPVAAAPPGTPPGPPTPSTFELHECGSFIVDGVITSGKAKVIDLPGDAQIFTSPGQSVTLTNRKNQKSVTYVITGSSHVTYFPNAVDPKRVTVSATGRNVLTIPLDDPNGRAGIYLTVGNVTYVLDGNGNQLEAFTGPGKVTNICRVLA